MKLTITFVIFLTFSSIKTDEFDEGPFADPDRCVGIDFKCQECSQIRLRCEYLNLTTILPIQDAPPETTRSVIFRGNSLPIINSTIFPSPMINLLDLDLSYNQIEYLGANTFENLPVVTGLSLDGNRIDLSRGETLQAFNRISDSLQQLNMSNTLVVTIEDQTSLVDIKLHRLFRLVHNLTELRLSNNSLRTFNIDNTVDMEGLIEEADKDYEDILCLMPRLEKLYLDRNKLAKIDFETKCLSQSSRSSLYSLQLQSNKLTNINDGLIKIFRHMKAS